MEVPTGTTEFRPLSRPGKMRDFVSSPPRERERGKKRTGIWKKTIAQALE